MGKKAFLKGPFQFSDLITGQFPTLPGTLPHTDSESNGFLAFLCLVGVAYYQEPGSFFRNSPVSYYNFFSNPDARKQHTQWYYGIVAKANAFPLRTSCLLQLKLWNYTG